MTLNDLTISMSNMTNNNQETAVHKVLSKENIMNNNEFKNDSLYHFKTLYGKDYEPFAKAFLNITTHLKAEFKPIKFKHGDNNIVLIDFILNCIANPLFFNEDQAFVDSYLIFAQKHFLPILKQTNLLFLFFKSSNNFAFGLIPNNTETKTDIEALFEIYSRHNLTLVKDVLFLLKSELKKIIRIKYKPEISFEDIKKHYFFMTKELIDFNTKTLNLLLILNSQIFCSSFGWPLLGFFDINDKQELSTLTTEDWTAPFKDDSLQNLFKEIKTKKNNKKNNKNKDDFKNQNK